MGSNWNAGRIEGDSRKVVTPFLFMNLGRRDGGRSHYVSASPSMQMRVSTGLTGRLSFNLFQNVDDWQWIYLVWSQGRDYGDDEYGQGGLRDDYDNLFKQRPDNTFLIKMSYWFSR